MLYHTTVCVLEMCEMGCLPFGWQRISRRKNERAADMKSENWADKYGDSALIAGGSEGIGLAFAMRLARQGVRPILVARNKDNLATAAEKITNETGVEVETHSLDLTVSDLDSRVDEIINGREIGTLIYNAGAVHGAGLFLDKPLDHALGLIRLNCIGPVTLVHKLGHAMRRKKRGAVILVSSMSGLCGSGYIAAYASSKSYEITFAESIWLEFKADGVDTLGLIAGSTRTPSMERAGLKFSPDAEGKSDSMDIRPMDPDDVASEGLSALGTFPTHVAGESNRQSVAWLRSAPRTETIDVMTRAGGNMFGLPPLSD